MVLGVDPIELREIINVGIEDRCPDQISRLSARVVRWANRAAITGLFGSAAQAACQAVGRVSRAIVGCG
jgi:hypothetical protein